MVSRRERYEARFHALNLAKRGDYELYNGMVTRLEQALEAGDIEGGMDASMGSTRERAHILLHQATSSLATDSKPKASSSSHSRQQAADWAKANAAAIEPRGSTNNSNRSARSLRRSHEDDDESETEQDINTTRALLQEAAARLKAGGINLEAGVNNVIYEKLMQELGLMPKVNSKSPSNSRSTRKASTEQEKKTNSNSPASLRARREYAASVLTEARPKEGTATFPPTLAMPTPLVAGQSRLERRPSAMEILKNLKEKQQHNPAPIRRGRVFCAGATDIVKQQQSSASTGGSAAARARQSVLSASQTHAAAKPLPIFKRSSSTEPQPPKAALPSRHKSDPNLLRSSKKCGNSRIKPTS